MKKILSLLLALTMVITLFNGVTVSAATVAGTCGDNLTWTLDKSSGLLTISGTGDMYDFEWNGSPWYSDNDFVKRVDISYGVTRIGSCAFWNCICLEKVEIPNSVKGIGYGAFTSTDIKSLHIPESVTDIPDSITFGAGFLETITVDAKNPVYVSKGNCLINKNAKKLISGCNSSVIPGDGSVEKIGESAFEGIYNLTSIRIPDTVTTIDDFAFWCCDSLETVYIPASVTNIGFCAFSGCPNAEFSVAQGNKEYFVKGNCLIEKDTKTLIAGTNSSVIPDDGSVEIIGDSSFNYCSFEKIVIPEGVVYIDGYAFYDCNNLKEIYLPLSLESIGYDILYTGHESDFTDIYYAGTEAQWDMIFINEENENFLNANIHFGVSSGTSEPSEEIIASGKCGDNLNWSLDTDGVMTISGSGEMYVYNELNVPWYYYRESIKSVVIKYGVESIGEYAFYSCDAIESVKIDNSVLAIGDSAFSECDSLTEVTIGDNVLNLGDSAFYGCDSLVSVTLGNGLRRIGNLTFSDCPSLTDVTIGSNITKIGFFAFAVCKSLTEITIPASVTSIDFNAFIECTSLTDVYYDGSESQWNAVSVGEGNEALLNASVYFGASDKSSAVVSGNIKAFGDNTKDVTIELMSGDEVIDTKTVTGNTGTYTFEDVEEGTYTVRVSKTKHAPREYTVTVTDADVTQDVEIWLYGDITADGNINSGDALQISRKVANLSSMFNQVANKDYRFKVANLTKLTTGDDSINSGDLLQISRMVANLSSVFDRIA